MREPSVLQVVALLLLLLGAILGPWLARLEGRLRARLDPRSSEAPSSATHPELRLEEVANVPRPVNEEPAREPEPVAPGRGARVRRTRTVAARRPALTAADIRREYLLVLVLSRPRSLTSD